MPDLTTSAVTAWLREHEPAIADDSPIMPIEEAPSVQPLLPQLGDALGPRSGAGPDRAIRRTSRKIRCATRCALCWRRWARPGVCACSHGSRKSGLPNPHTVLGTVLEVDASGSGRALRDSLRSHYRRALLARMFARADRASDGACRENAVKRALLASALSVVACACGDRGRNEQLGVRHLGAGRVGRDGGPDQGG